MDRMSDIGVRVNVRRRTKVLSLVGLLGLRPLGGIMSWPAAMKSPSLKIFWKNHSLLAAGAGGNIFAVNAMPVERQQEVLQCG